MAKTFDELLREILRFNVQRWEKIEVMVQHGFLVEEKTPVVLTWWDYGPDDRMICCKAGWFYRKESTRIEVKDFEHDYFHADLKPRGFMELAVLRTEHIPDILTLMRNGESVAGLFTWCDTDRTQEKQLLEDFEKWERTSKNKVHASAVSSTFEGRAVEVHFKDVHKALSWTNQFDWKQVRKETKFMSFHHQGHGLRFWVGWSAHVSAFAGGHFDSNENKWFDLTCKQDSTITTLLETIKQKMGGEFLVFDADLQNRLPPGFSAPLQIIVPV